MISQWLRDKVELENQTSTSSAEGARARSTIVKKIW